MGAWNLKEKQAAIARLRFSPSRHVYTLDGMRIPSVTQVIDPLMPFDRIPLEVRREALLRGELVHKLTELWDKMVALPEDILEEAKSGGLLGYVHAWAKFEREMSVEILACEVRVYHMAYRYAGTLDRIARLNGEIALLEIKTGALQPEYQLQTAAYMEAYNEGDSNKIRARFVVQLAEDGAYHVKQHKDKADFDVFKAALTIQNWRLRYAGS